MLNDIRESLGKVSRNQYKLTVFKFAPISSTCTYICALGGLDSQQTLKTPVVSLQTIFSWQSEKCLYLRFSFHQEVVRGKFLPQRTPSARHKEDYPHKKNLKVFLLKIGSKRDITLFFYNMFLKTDEKCG